MQGHSVLGSIKFFWASAILAVLCAVTVHIFVYAGTTPQTNLTIGAATPIVSGVVLNNGNPIVLNPNATTTVYINAVVTDYNGCSDILTNGTTSMLVYRSGVGSSTCASANNMRNCYFGRLTASSCASTSTSANVTGTVEMYYFADSTLASSTASSSYESQNWLATVIATDASSTSGSADSNGVELYALLAIGISTSSVNYGTVSPSSTSGSANQSVGIINVGNASTSVFVHGTALASGVNSIATSSQHYSSSTFTYGGGEQPLSGTETELLGVTIRKVGTGVPTSTTSLSQLLVKDASLAHRNYLYRLGGWPATGGAAVSTVSYARINGDGTIGAWGSTQNLPGKRQYHVAIGYGDYAYVLGGCNGSPLSPYLCISASRSSGYFGAVNADGTISSWNTFETGSAPGNNPTGFARNGFLYYLGGDADGNGTSTVYYAPINATGSLGTWATTTSLPAPLSQMNAVVDGGRVYVMGGYSYNDVAGTSTVISAAINSDGTLGSWTGTVALPSPLYAYSASGGSGILTVAGGYDNIALATTSVFYAPVHSDGSLGVWQVGSPLPLAVSISYGGSQANSFDNGFHYIVGGSDESGQALNSVYVIPLHTHGTYWGLGVPNGTPTGTYSGVNTFTAAYQP